MSATGAQVAPALRLYKRLCYIVDGTVRDYDAPGIGKVLCRKTL